MKKAYYSLVTVLMAGCVMLSSCMTAAGTSTGTTANSNNGAAVQTGAAIASALLSQKAQTNSTAAAASNILSAVNSGSAISAIIGLLTGGTSASTASIVGTWTYAEPTVQFQSENLLAQAGGVYVAQTMVKKLSPYYEKFGFKSGSLKITFNSDNTCSIMSGSRNIPGTYTFNPATNALNIKGQLGLVNLSAFVTLSPNQMALTFDSTKLITLATALGAGSNNSALSSVSQLAGSYSGMKTGFLFTK